MRPLLPLAITITLSGCGRFGFDPVAVRACGQVQPTYPLHAGWMQYVDITDLSSDREHQPDLSCSGIEPGGPESCIHGGAHRKLPLDEVTACDGIVADDALGAFQWRCQVEQGTAVLYGTLRDLGLTELVDGNDWLPNRVEVTRAGSPVCATELTAWWDTAVAPLPANLGTGVVELSTPDTVYVLDASRATSGYVISADRVSIVVRDGATLRYDPSAGPNCNSTTGLAAAPDAHCVISAGAADFFWIEGHLAGEPSTPNMRGVLVHDTHFSRLHRLDVRGTSSQGIEMFDTLNARLTLVDQQSAVAGNGIALHRFSFGELTRVRAAANANSGILIDGSSSTDFLQSSAFNVLDEVVVAGNGWQGLLIDCAAHHNVVTRVLATGNGLDGVYSGCNVGTILSHITAVNNGRAGLQLDRGNRHRVSQLVASGNAADGLRIDNGDYKNDVASVFATDNGGYGVYLDASDTRFLQFLAVGNNASGSCRVVGRSMPGLLDATCTTTGADGSSSFGSELSTATLRIGSSIGEAFIGKITSDDDASAFDVLGTAVKVDDWWAVASRSRTWGLDGGAFPDPTNRGRCTSGCRLWAWDVAASGALHDRSLDGVTRNSSFVASAPCPAAVAGDVVIARPLGMEVLDDGIGDDDGYCEAGEACRAPSTYLINALEVRDDAVGNNDGLCESDERCMYAPDLGTAPSHLGDTSPQCVFVDGAVTGVEMFAAP